MSMSVKCRTRLPDRLIVTFPNGDAIKNGDKKPAGSTVGECCFFNVFWILSCFLITILSCYNLLHVIRFYRCALLLMPVGRDMT